MQTAGADMTPNDLDRKAREPKFGDWLRGVYASERNPIRDGIYVRTCRVNHETCYELTDGKGKFWMYPKRSTERLDRPSVFEEAALRLAVPEWRPIETAPTTISDHTKCGEQVILGGDGWVDTGFYHDGSECYGHRGGAGWFAMDDWGSGLLTASNLHPTHWMPLPAAPTVSAEVESDAHG